MSDELVFFSEVDSLNDAHFIGQALEAAGVPYRVAEHISSGLDVAFSHGWGMLYIASDRFEEAKAIIEQVREDEDAILDAAEAAESEGDGKG